MAVLCLIRHARASAQGADYDVLQPDGEAQARRLGEHLHAQRRSFDALYVGPHRRQQETLRIARQAAGETGRAWPEPVLLAELAEAPYDAIVKQHLPQRLGRDSLLDAHVAALAAALDRTARDQAIQSIVSHVVALWRAGEIAGDDVESSLAFEARVDRALDRIREDTPLGAYVGAFTSYAVIDRVLRRAGSHPPAGAPMHPLFNTSLSLLELQPTLELLAYNLVEHLPDASERTLL